MGKRTSKKPIPKVKLWLEFEGKRIAGMGKIALLKNIEETGSIKEAAKRLAIPYRTAWHHLKKMEGRVGQLLVKTFKGGVEGGGGAKLTNTGKLLLREYERYEGYLRSVMDDSEFWEAISLKLSARNRLRGTIKRIEKDAVAASIKVEIQTPAVITAVITKEAVKELGLRVGDHVEAVIKATEVMIAK